MVRCGSLWFVDVPWASMGIHGHPWAAAFKLIFHATRTSPFSEVKAIETSISTCFKLKQELGSYALMGHSDVLGSFSDFPRQLRGMQSCIIVYKLHVSLSLYLHDTYGV